MKMEKQPNSVSLTPKGLALCHFLFRDAPAASLSQDEAWEIGQRLIDQWDGSRSLMEMYTGQSSLDAEVVSEEPILDAEEIDG